MTDCDVEVEVAGAIFLHIRQEKRLSRMTAFIIDFETRSVCECVGRKHQICYGCGYI